MDRGWIGFRRKNGTVGLRNYLAVIAATDAANPVARRIAASVPGAIAITPLYGRGQLGDDLELSINTMAGLGINPNVYATLIISLEPVAGGRVAERIASSGKLVETLSIQGALGTSNLQQAAKKLLEAWAADVGRLTRTIMDPGELVIGLECGGSDTTSGIVSNPAIGIVADQLIDWGAKVIFSEPVECMGGEDALASRCKTPEIGAAVREMVLKYERIAENAGVDLNAINPAPDNIRGGLTTIEEKSLGALCKTGTRALSGVLGYGEAPRASGLYLMDAPAAATENLTAIAAGGTHAILFGTGALNSIGNPVSPTIKVCGNPRTCLTMSDHIDVDLSDVITGGSSITQAGERILEFLRDVSAGKETRCEALGEIEVAISKSVRRSRYLQGKKVMVTKGFVMHGNDNVATLVNGADEGEIVTLHGFADGSLVAKMPIPNGHKIAIRDLPSGSDVIKYGFVVGRTVKPAGTGEHLHVQNMQSHRGRGDLRPKS